MKKFCLLITALCALSLSGHTQIVSNSDGDYALIPISDTNKIDLTDKSNGYTLKIYDNGGVENNYSSNCDGYMLLTVADGSSIILSGNVNTESGWDNLYVYDGENSSANLINSYTGNTTINTISSDNNLFFNFYSDGSANYSGFEITATVFTPIIDGDFVYADNAKTQLLKYNGSAESITIPPTVKSISDKAFKNCSSLKTLTIGSIVESIGGEVFDGCDNLTSVTIESNADFSDANLTFTKDGIRYNVHSKDNVSVAPNSYSGNVVIPTSVTAGNTFTVTSIDDEAFYNCNHLKSVIIPESVTRIGSEAFCHCDSLSSIILPNSVREIGSYAFAYCNLFESIEIPSLVTSIDYAAFHHCDSLKSVITESNADFSNANLTFIKDGIRYNVHSKDNVGVAPNSYSGNVVIPTSVVAGNTFTVTSIDDEAFYNCNHLKSVIIPESVTRIGSESFYHCDSLTSIVLPNSLTSINSSTFYSCTNLKSVVIGSSISNIDYYAFANCDSLTSITISCGTPPSANSGAFYNVDNLGLITLRVPEGSKSYYQEHYLWSKMNIVEFAAYNVTLVANNATTTGDGPYEATSTAKAVVKVTPNTGYQFAHWSDGNTDNPRTINLTSDTTLTAIIVDKYCTVTLLVDDVQHGYIQGSTTVREGNGNYYSAYGVGEYTFDHWNVGYSNSNSIYFYVTKDTTIKAFFKKSALCQVKLSSNDYIMGTVSNNTSAYAGSQVSISALGNEGYRFVKWSDENTNRYRTINVNSDTNLIAFFEPLKKYYVEFAVADSCKQMGKITYNGKSEVYEGSNVSATAEAGNIYSFKGWYYANGTLYSTNSNISFNVNRDTTMYAVFQKYVKPEYEVVPYSGIKYVTLNIGETINIYDSEGLDNNYLNNNNGLLQINAPNGYAIQISGSYDIESGYDYLSIHQGSAYGAEVARWEGNSSDMVIVSDSIATIYFSSDGGVTYSGFSLKATTIKLVDPKDVPYKVNLASNDTALGNVAINNILESSGNYLFNLQIDEKRAGRFNRWSDGSLSSNRALTVKSDTSLTAIFDTLKAYTVTIQSNDTMLGAIQGNQSDTYYEGEQISFNAYEKVSKARFVKWSDGNTYSNRSLYITQDTTLTAEFETRKGFVVNLVSNDTSLAEFTACDTIYEGYDFYPSNYYTIKQENVFFVNWNNGSTRLYSTFKIISDTTIVGNFEKMPYKFDVQPNDTTMGTVNKYVTERINQYIYKGYIYAFPKEGYVFKNWNDGFVNSNRSTFYITSDTIMIANFEPIKYKVDIASENGEVTCEYNKLNDSTYTLSCNTYADEGYCFANWHDSITMRNRTFAINSDTAIAATFVKFPYNINVSCDENKGSINYTTAYSSLEKPMVDFSVIENPGYAFIRWSTGSTSKSISLTLYSDTTISAIFEETAIKVLVASNDTAMGKVSYRTINWAENYTYTNIAVTSITDGYHFVMWSDSVVSSNRYDYFYTDTTITAIFAPNIYKIVATVNDETMGSVEAPDSAAFNSVIKLTAKAADGYKFSKWSDGNTDNPRTITITNDVKLTAEFEKVNNTDINELELISTNIYAYQNVIVVENAVAEIRIYDAMGRLVTISNDENAEIRINSTGIYVVKVGNISKRIMINE